MTFLTKKKNIFLYSIPILISGIFLRHYQLNFESYWFDEIVTFWVSDPTLNFAETLKRSFEIDNGTNLIFNIITKYFFYIFGYSPEIGRYVPFIFGVLSIPFLSYLSYLYFPSKVNYILSTFLISFNWYLISYSQEVRLYSFQFLLSIISLIIFHKLCKKIYKKEQIINSCFYIFFTTVAISNHIFFLIIIFSKFIYIILKFNSDRSKILFLLFNIFCSVLLFIILMYKPLIYQLSINEFWITQIDISFFSNFYFSRFFGSKIMGFLFLILLIFLIIKFKKELFNRSNELILLLLIIITSYSIPLIYSLIFIPILIDRYIIFVLIPILILISILTSKINNKSLFISIIFLLCSSSLVNTYLDVFKGQVSKPEFNKSINFVLQNNMNKIYLKDNKHNNLVINYLQNIETFKKNEIEFIINEKDFLKSNFLFICYEPINGFECSLRSKLENSNLIDQKNLQLLKLFFYKNKNF